MTAIQLDTPETALLAFADSSTSPRDRRAALTTLSTAKFLPKHADDPAILAGRRHWLDMVYDTSTRPEFRLLGIAESIRLSQIVKRWAPEIIEQLRPVFASELPPISLLGEADDRLNFARACSAMPSPWLSEYVARGIADEETGEKARSEMLAALFARSSCLSEVLDNLSEAFEVLRPSTEAPGDSVGRRLTRTLSALRENLLESELEAGEDLGLAVLRLLSLPFAKVGKPDEEKVRIELSHEALLVVHDVVRTRISVVADPQMYRVVEYCRKFFGGGSWPDGLKKPLERLITDVSEALVLLGRQGQCDQPLLGQLDVLCNYPERARVLARELAVRHPELPETVRDWLERGKLRVVRHASESAIEAAASSADESIGLALHAARQARSLRDSLREPLASNLLIYEPNLAVETQELLDRIQVLAIQVEQAASMRSLDLYGVPGEEIEMSPKFFTVVSGLPRQRMTVKQPAIVRIRPDGTVGDVVVKGLVE